MTRTEEVLAALTSDELAALTRRLLSKLSLPRTPDGKIDRDAPWLWKSTNSIDEDGYPKISVTSAAGTVKAYAHRVAFFLKYGYLPRIVRHAEPIEVIGPDVNPFRLLPGCPKTNAADTVRQGRTAKGSKNGQATLDEVTVARIKADLAAGMGIRAAARKHGSTPGAVGAIKQGRTWKHVPWPSDERAV